MANRSEAVTHWQDWSDENLIGFIVAFWQCECGTKLKAMCDEAEREIASRHPCSFDKRDADLILEQTEGAQ